jgi:hypothetical protein
MPPDSAAAMTPTQTISTAGRVDRGRPPPRAVERGSYVHRFGQILTSATLVGIIIHALLTF